MTRNKTLTFSENFTLTGIAACLSKTTAAPIERVKDKVLKISNPQEPVAPFIADLIREPVNFSKLQISFDFKTSIILCEYIGVRFLF